MSGEEEPLVPVWAVPLPAPEGTFPDAPPLPALEPVWVRPPSWENFTTAPVLASMSYSYSAPLA